MKHHIVYVPGLGDKRSYGQPALLQIWRLFGLTPHYHPVGWADKEAFEPKLQRLLAEIDRLKTSEDKVSLVGVSAGASAALTAYTQRLDSVSGVVCISGKIQNPQHINQRYFTENPAFKDSVFGLQAPLNILKAEDRARIMSIHPIKDQTVPIADTIVPGAVEKQVPVRGHVQSIFYSLLFSARSISIFLKNIT